MVPSKQLLTRKIKRKSSKVNVVISKIFLTTKFYIKNMYFTILSLVGTPNIRGTPLILGVTPNKNFGFWSKILLGKLKKIFFNCILNRDFQQNLS